MRITGISLLVGAVMSLIGTACPAQSEPVIFIKTDKPVQTTFEVDGVEIASDLLGTRSGREVTMEWTGGAEYSKSSLDNWNSELNCAEWVDNSANILTAVLPAAPSFELEPMEMTVEERQYPMTAIFTNATDKWSGNAASDRQFRMKLIPYYAWAHRGSGNMLVWLNSDAQPQRRGR